MSQGQGGWMYAMDTNIGYEISTSNYDYDGMEGTNGTFLEYKQTTMM